MPPTELHNPLPVLWTPTHRSLQKFVFFIFFLFFSFFPFPPPPAERECLKGKKPATHQQKAEAKAEAKVVVEVVVEVTDAKVADRWKLGRAKAVK